MHGYRAILDDAQIIARRAPCFGLRVHIGVEDRELAVEVMDTMRYLLPHILCLSASSPLWAGRNTGLKSYRSVRLDALLRTGIPGFHGTYQEYRAYIDTLIGTNCFPDARQVRYDIMPHARFPTLVIRIRDMMPGLGDALALTALIQAPVAWMVDLRRRNLSFRHDERLLIAENKWRDVRFGLGGKLLDFGIAQTLPAPELIRELLAHVERGDSGGKAGTVHRRGVPDHWPGDARAALFYHSIDRGRTGGDGGARGQARTAPVHGRVGHAYARHRSPGP